MIIWVVLGVSGEHAEREEWLVCAHRTLESAEVKKKMFETWAELHSVMWHDGGRQSQVLEGRQQEAAKAAWRKLWPAYPIHIDYTGIRWEVLELEYDADDQITP